MAFENLLTIFLPGFTPTTFDLDQFGRDYVLMGRGQFHVVDQSYNDIQIDPSFQFVSRSHCIFKRDTDGTWWIEDDGSANGIKFHDQKVPYHHMSDGDKIYIGKNIEERVVLLYTRREVADSIPQQYEQQPQYDYQYDQQAQQAADWSQGGSGVLPQDSGQIAHDSLTMMAGPDEGVAPSRAITSSSVVQNYPLKGKDQCVIGRLSTCDIVLDHPSVSRQHCIISQQNGQYYIYDNNSTNGVILNSELLQKSAPLNQMDRITIAGSSFIFCDECLYTYEPEGGMSISISQLCKEVGKRGNKKLITNNVNLFVEPNKFVAIVGGSGSGKTTLLNCMSGMTDFTAGEVLINGESIRTSGNSLRSIMGYVPQQDIVYDSLSLEHMLRYSAKLRMPPDTSNEEIQRKIDETLELVELTAHRDTLISKLSGGERKRASIAVELLASPRLFFLDEPSSGLDPGTEKHLMQMLKRLSTMGKTVVMVTHTVQNLDLCDMVICMGRGGVLCYAGSPANALQYFQKGQYTDIYDELNENPIESAQRYLDTHVANAAPPADIPGSEKPKKPKKGIAASLREFWAMTCRYVEILANNRARLILLLAMPIVLTLLVCIAFQADGNFNNVLRSTFGSAISLVRENFPFLVAGDTMSLLFAFSCACFWTGIFNSIQEVSKERTIYERERFAGVGVVPYVMSKFVPLFVLCLIQSVCMSAILAFMTNTTATVDGNVNAVTALPFGMGADGVVLGPGMLWLENFITTFLCVLSAMCLGLLISTLVSNEMALVLCPVCLMPQILFSGVVGTLTGVTKMLSEVITCKWSCLAFFISANINDLYKSAEYKTGTWELKTFSDDDGVGLLDAAYEPTTEYLFGLNGTLSAWIVMGIMCIVCVVGAMLALRFKRMNTR